MLVKYGYDTSQHLGLYNSRTSYNNTEDLTLQIIFTVYLESKALQNQERFLCLYMEDRYQLYQQVSQSDKESRYWYWVFVKTWVGWYIRVVLNNEATFNYLGMSIVTILEYAEMEICMLFRNSRYL
jgi:hypothetical protein